VLNVSNSNERLTIGWICRQEIFGLNLNEYTYLIKEKEKKSLKLLRNPLWLGLGFIGSAKTIWAKLKKKVAVFNF
jgi:hypothetical protein